MKFQTRSTDGDIRFHPTLEHAFDHAQEVQNIEKVSFTIPETSERVRLIRSPNGWILEDVYGDRKI